MELATPASSCCIEQLMTSDGPGGSVADNGEHTERWFRSHVSRETLIAVFRTVVVFCIGGVFAWVAFKYIWTGEVPKSPEAADVADEWSKSISRLGILPVFPPEEDFHVGDIWAVISQDNVPKSGLLNRGFRIGHLDLRPDIIEASKGLPLFAPTAAIDEKEKFRSQPRSEVANDAAEGIALSLAAFPGITLNHSEKRTAAAGQSFFGSAAERDTEEVEETRIPVAETYGAPVEAAMAKLAQWCSSVETAPRCRNHYIRNLLSFGIDPRVSHTTGDDYDIGIQIQVVVRVFLTREIEHHRHVSGSRGATVRITGDGTSQATLSSPASTDPAATARANATADNIAKAADTAQSRPAGAGAGSIVQVGAYDVQLNEVFQRPVVFGYRAINLFPLPDPGKKQ
jgi:hypothetical protein